MAKNTHIIEIKTTGAAKSEKQIKGVSSGLTKMAKQAGVAAAAYFGSQALLGGIKSSIDLFAKQEQAEKKLRFAAGDATEELIRQAEQLQKNTVFGDEAIIGQQAYVKSLGISTEQTKEIISASVDLASAMNISLESAVMNTTKTLSGMQGELGEKLPAAFKELTPEMLKAGEGIKFIADQFGGTAQADADTFAGSMAQMSNAVGDAGEAFGAILAPAIRMTADVITFLAGGLNKIMNLEEHHARSINDSVEAYDDYKRSLLDYDTVVSNMSFDELLSEFFTLNEVTDESAQLILREKALRGELSETINDLSASTENFSLITEDNSALQEIGLTQNEMIIAQNARIIEDIDRKSEAIIVESEIMDSYMNTRDLQMEKEEAAIELEDKYILKMRERGQMLDVLTSQEKKQQKAHQDRVDQTALTISSIGQLSGNQKTAAIADAISSTYTAANEEYSKFVKTYPAPFGTVIGIAMAAATVARGIENVQKIRATKAQYGADFIADSPQLLMVGEGSGEERIQVTPLVDSNIDGPQGGSGIVLNISGNVMSDEWTESELIPKIREGLRLGENLGL